MAKSNKSFEEKIITIESILAELENGETPIDKLVKDYETGIQLINECRAFLESAELKIKELNRSDN